MYQAEQAVEKKKKATYTAVPEINFWVILLLQESLV